MSEPIKVLCVDDSALVRSLMTEIINAQPDMTVVATAPDPLVARDLIKQHNPDVLTLDVEGEELTTTTRGNGPVDALFAAIRKLVPHDSAKLERYEVHAVTGGTDAQAEVSVLLAEDGTVEAVSVRDARAFAVGVQWHPEYWVNSDSASAKIFRAFGDAVRAHAGSRLGARAAAE